MQEYAAAFLEFPRGMSALFLFWLGAGIASFIGLAVDRLPHQLEWCERPDPRLTLWAPRSHCLKCKKTLGVMELVPILGWLLGRGRCRGCSSEVSWTYPASELALGLATIVTLWIFEDPLERATFILLLWASLFLSWMDLKEQWLPAVVTTPLLWIGLMASPFEGDALLRVYGAAIAGGGMALLFWITSKIKKIDAYSGGDVALMACSGAWVGAWGLIDFMVLASFFMMVHTVPMHLRGEEGLPLGPSLSLALLGSVTLRSHEIGLLLPV